jgi:hypothetical protein
MSFLEKGKDFNRLLTSKEIGIFTSINPDTGHQYFPQAHTETIKFLAKGGEYTNDANSPLCEQYDCMQKDALIHLYNKITGDYISQLSHYNPKTLKNICELEKFECIVDIQYYATYNCIGWAIGVTKWVNPSDITAYIKEGLSVSKAINSFLDDKAKLYEKSPANILNIVDDLSSIAKSDVELTNNTVVFYFDKNNEFLHGARYVENLLETEVINRWTSKLGQSILISHELDDLRGEYSLYGDNIAYATIINTEQINNHDEL